MEIKNDKKRQKIWLLASILLVLAIAGATYIYLNTDRFNRDELSSEIDYNEPTDEQIQAGEETPEQQPPAETDDDRAPDQPPPGDSGNDSESGNIFITVANQQGATFTIRTLIQDVAHGGSCELTLRHGSTVAHREAVGTQMVASNSTCMGFDVNTSSFTAGTYTATITYSLGQSSTSTSQEITIN